MNYVSIIEKISAKRKGRKLTTHKNRKCWSEGE